MNGREVSSVFVQFLIVVAWILLMSVILVYSFTHFNKMIKTIPLSIRLLFKDFRQKMWMTAGIGSIFAMLYLIVVLAGSIFIDSKSRLDIFFLLYRHPTEFIYLGLLLFASITLCIYIARMLIIYLYNTRNK